MLKFTPIILFALILLISSNVFAESSASVTVENKVSSSNENTKSNTEIRVETNGNVTEYSSDEPNQKIEVKAVEGESEIKIDEEVVTVSPTPEATTTPEESNDDTQDEIKKEDDSNIVVTFFKKIFSFLGFL